MTRSDHWRAVSLAASAFAVGSGTLTLCAWQSSGGPLWRLVGGRVAMNPTTALCFVMAGLALSLSLFLQSHEGKRAVVASFAAVVSALGLLRVCVIAGIVALPIDDFLFRAQLGDLTHGRMAASTALAFFLLGLALLTSEARNRRGNGPAELLVLGAMALASLPFVGHLYGMGPLVRFRFFAPMAWNTALSFLVLGAGILSRPPDGIVIRLLSSPGAGGIAGRRLLPVSVLGTLLLGWLCFEGLRLRAYDGGVAFSLLIVSTIALFVALTWITVRQLDRLDEERRSTRSELERSHVFLDSIIENIPNMIFVKDARDLRFVRFNRAGEELLGYKREDLLGKNDYDFFPQEEADFFTGKDREVLDHRSPVDIPDEEIATRNLGVRILHTRKVPILDADGSPLYLLGISEDITERRHSERKILQLNEDLRKQAEQLQAANQEMEAFSYSVSHDLRAPVRHIDGFTDLLREEVESSLDEKALRYLSQITESAKHMGALIDDLLVFSRMSRIDLQFHPVSLECVVQEARARLETEVAGREIEWKIGRLPMVEGDPAMLRTVFVNLLSNAIKYTRPRRPAVIEIGSVEGATEATVFIRDNGVGFDAEYGHKLFGVFQRLHPIEEFEGTGIGLASVRRVIQRHGGKTWAEGKAGCGATFFFSLPHPPEAQSETRAAA